MRRERENMSEIGDKLSKELKEKLNSESAEKLKNDLKDKFNSESTEKFKNDLKNKLDNSFNGNNDLKEKLNNKKVIIIGAAVIILLLIIISRGCGKGISMSKDEIAETALKQAEQNYGYKLTLDSCEVVDTSSSKRKWPLTGEKVKVNVYGVLLKADANDSAGNTVESLKYEVLIQQWDYDNNISAQAVDCTDLDDKDIVQKIKEDVKNAE